MTDHPVRPVTRHRYARRLAAATVLAVLAPMAVVVVGPTLSATAAPTPVRAKDVRVEPTRVAPRDLGGQLPARTRAGAVTAPQRVARGLAVVGATWVEGAVQDGDRLELRVRRDGDWQPWQPMEVDDASHGPDAGTPEAKTSRGGTLPAIVDGEESQVRILTQRAVAPTVEVSFIDPGRSDADASVGAAVPGSASAAAARPTIHTRKEWGADESLRQGSPSYGQVQVGLVHHTDGSNTYSADQVPGILRGIYEFHVNGRGWSDVGYQFLVDRFGRIWEGRAGGVDKAVTGAQAGGYNSGTFGASVMGNFASAAVPSAVTTALTNLFAWKFTVHGIPAYGRVAVSDKTFNRIGGHRDANSTACPGRLYDKLPALRTAVAARIGSRPSSILQRSVDAGRTPDLLAAPDDTATLSASDLSVLRSASPQPVTAGLRIGTGWGSLRHIVLSPDLTGDGRADILAVSPASTALRVYAGNGAGGSSSMTEKGRGWQVMTKLVASGDRTGDRRADLLAVRNDGALVLYEGDGAGWFRSGRSIATGFGDFRSVVDVGDITHDGLRDLLAIRSSTNTLEAFPGARDGGVAAPVRWGAGWSGLDALVAGPDLDRDGRVGDISVRQSDGRMRTYYADETGRMPRMNTWGKGWAAADELSSGADWSGDGVPDVIGRIKASGDLVVFTGTGQRDFSPTPLPVRSGVPSGTNLFRVVGDLDGDGLADAVARTAAGDLFALRGRGDGGFSAAPTRIAGGWGVYDLVEPVGDYTNDGVPDLVARGTDGQLRVFAMTRAMTFAWQLPVGSGWQGTLSITATGAVNGDVNADVVALRGDGSVRLYRGTGPGALNYYDVVLTGQADLAHLVGTGDLTGDGRNDLVGQTHSGSLYVYPGDAQGGFLSSRQLLRSPQEADRALS